jgi:ammonia channel protein AmtB
MNQDFLALLAIVIAGVVAVSSQPGSFTPWETIIGFILSVLLFCINRTGFHTFPQKLAFWAIAGLCGTITFGFFIEKLLGYFDILPKEESEGRHWIFFCLWVLLSLVAVIIFPF